MGQWGVARLLIDPFRTEGMWWAGEASPSMRINRIPVLSVVLL